MVIVFIHFPGLSVSLGMKSQNHTVLGFEPEMFLIGSCVRSPAVSKVVTPIEGGASLEEVIHRAQALVVIARIHFWYTHCFLTADTV